MDLDLPEKRVFIGPARVWKRLLAFVVDFLILDFFVFGVYKSLMSQFIGKSRDFSAVYSLLQNSPDVVAVFKGVLFLIVLFALVYFVLLEYLLGRTPGKMLMDIHVVSDVPGGKGFMRPSFSQCILRSLFIVPVIPLVLFWLADPVYFFVAKKNQRLSEWLSRTRVVEEFSF